MNVTVSVRAETLRKRLDTLKRRASAAVMREAQAEVFKAAREGPRGISDQFRSGVGYFQNNTAIRWEPTKEFGYQRKPTRTLIRTGFYRDAWMGRNDGTVEGYTAGRFNFGVSPAICPQVNVFQKSGVTRIGVTQKMRGFLGFMFGVHLRKSTKVIVVPGRPVGVSAEMVARMAEAIKRHILKGDKAAGR